MKNNVGTWSDAILKAHVDLLKEQNTKEIGKIRQHANEYLQQDWINSSTELDPLRHSEIKADASLMKNVIRDHNESGWDLIDKSSGLRIQSKYRGGNSVHMEQTRRNSKKNEGKASASGHVVYSEGEFDVAVITRPSSYSNDCTGRDFIVIPEQELRDPKNPGYLYRNVPKRVWSLWQEKDSVETLNDLRRGKIDANRN
tara:strand:+ start:74 stop:670 length:597 start_codon:yes stop_codon:yes gene_type:complete